MAVRDKPDEAALRAARVNLRARQDMLRRTVEQWIETVGNEYCYDRTQWQRQAAEFGALLRGYLPEIAGAASAAELEAVAADINEVIRGDLCTALRAEYQQAQERAERQYEAREREAEAEAERKRAAEAEAERKRAAEAEAERKRAAEAEAERKAITAPSSLPYTPPSSPIGAGIYLATLFAYQYKEAKAKAIAQKGACQFEHWRETPADRLYGVPWTDVSGTVYLAYGTPQYLACRKHFDAAVARLRDEGYPNCMYWET